MAADSSERLVLLNHLADEFAARYRKGERPSLQEYVDRHPDLADDIREFFPALMEVEQVKEERAEAPAPPAAGPLPPLERLGDYRILREIGHGGMGVVYEAEQLSLGRHVALKMLPSSALLDPRQLERFEREAKAAARLHHTNIVPVHGVGEVDGRPYYVMQFIQGLGLDEVLAELKRLRKAGPNPGPEPGRASACAQALLTGRFPAGAGGAPPDSTFPPEPGASSPPTSSTIHLPGPPGHSALSQTGRHYWQSVARVGIQVAEALAYAHGQGTLHRDIKPSNLLLDAQGTVWVTDFGLAKAADSGDLTAAGEVVGTLRYIPPERFRGQSDGRGDVYSLGLTLYELLTLRAAFEEDGQHQLIEHILHDEPPRPRQLDPSVPRDLETIVLKAIAKDPAHRYLTASELAADLQRFLDDEPIQARPMPAWERGWRWAKRRPAAAALFLVSGLALLTAVGGIVSLLNNRRLQEANANTERALEAEAEQRRKAERFQYFDLIARAHADWQNGNQDRGKELLRDCPTDQRNWEYQYLNRLYNTALLTFPAPRDDGAVAFSPDGTRLAASGPDATVKVWDVRTGKEVFTLRGHTLGKYNFRRGANGLAFSPDGKWLASAGGDMTVRVWNMETGKEARQFTHKPRDFTTNLVMGVAFSPDGTLLASAGWDGNAYVWELETGRHRHHWPIGRGVNAVAFSPDGTRLIVAAYGWRRLREAASVWVWDVRKGKVLDRRDAHGEGVTHGVAYRPDGKQFASAGWDGKVKLWDATTFEVLHTLEGHTDDLIFSVAYSSDGARLASAGGDGTLRIWDTTTGKPLRTIRAHGGEVYSVAYSPDGTRLASYSWDGTVKVWDVTVDQEALPLTGHRLSVSGVAFSPDGARIASGSADGTLRIWDAVTGQEMDRLLRLQPGIRCVAFNPRGARLAAGVSIAGNARFPAVDSVWIWDVASRQKVRDLKGFGGRSTPSFSPDGKRIAYGGTRGRVIVCDVEGGAEPHSFQAHDDAVWAVAFSPDGTRLASASYDATIRLWDLASGEPVHRPLRGHTHGVYQVAFSPDGSRLASCSQDHTVKLWDVKTGQCLRTLTGHVRFVYCVAFNRDGTRLASGSWDNTIRIWDVETGKELIALRGHAGDVRSLAFSPDGARLVSGGSGGVVKVWDARPLTEDLRTERQAIGLLQFLFGKPLLKEEVIAAVRRSQTISESVRQKALVLVERNWDEPHRLNRASWEIVRVPGATPEKYREALRWAEVACRLAKEMETDYGLMLNTLGVAHYRLGQFPAALETLTKSEKLNATPAGSHPGDLAFLAMTQHQLGQKGQARTTLARLREIMAGPRWVVTSEEAKAFLREAAELIEGKKDESKR